MFKSIAVLAVVARASAMEWGDALTSFENLETTAQMASFNLNEASKPVVVASPAVMASLQSAERLSNLKVDVENAVIKAGEVTTAANGVVQETSEAIDAKWTEATETTDTYLAEQLANMKKAMDDQAEMISTQVDGMMDATEEKLEAVEAVQTKVKQWSSKTNNCQKRGLIWNGEKCVNPELGDDAGKAKVYYKKWRNDDGRDCGWLEGGRQLDFQKHEDDTVIRIFYYDNVRVHGHTAHVKYNVMICKAGAQQCSHCKTPGRIMHWRWSGHQHNWWMNDHTGATAYGLCKATDNFALTAGEYSIRILLEDCRYDTHTGSNQDGNLMVDEVFMQ